MSKTDTRCDCGEVREIGYAPIGTRIYCFVFTQREQAIHAINLRRAKGERQRGAQLCPKTLTSKKLNHGFELSSAEVSAAEFKKLCGRLVGSNKTLVHIRLDNDLL